MIIYIASRSQHQTIISLYYIKYKAWKQSLKSSLTPSKEKIKTPSMCLNSMAPFKEKTILAQASMLTWVAAEHCER